MFHRGAQRLEHKALLVLLLVLVVAAVVRLTVGGVPGSAVAEGVVAGQGGVLMGVDTRHQRVFVVAEDGTATVLDARTGALVRRSHLLRNSTATMYLLGDPVADRLLGHIFIANPTDHAVHMLDAGSGAVLHTTHMGVWRGGMATAGMAVDERSHRLLVTTPTRRTLTVLDTRSGKIVGEIKVGPTSSVVVDPGPGHAFVPVAGVRRCGPVAIPAAGAVCMIDESNGHVLRGTPIGFSRGRFKMAVDPVRHHLFVFNETDASVRMLDTRTGAQLRTLWVGAGRPDDTIFGGIAVDTWAGRVIVGAAGRGVDDIVLLDARTGTLLRRFVVGHDPNDLQGPIAVDERSGRAYVSGMDGTRVVDTRRGILLTPLAPSVAVATGSSGAVFLAQFDAPSGADQVANRYLPGLWPQAGRGPTVVRGISPRLPGRRP